MEDLVYGEVRPHSRSYKGSDGVRRVTDEMLVWERCMDDHSRLSIKQAERRSCAQIRIMQYHVEQLDGKFVKASKGGNGWRFVEVNSVSGNGQLWSQNLDGM